MAVQTKKVSIGDPAYDLEVTVQGGTRAVPYSAVAEELDLLLEKMGVLGPRILVAQSGGALILQSYLNIQKKQQVRS